MWIGRWGRQYKSSACCCSEPFFGLALKMKLSDFQLPIAGQPWALQGHAWGSSWWSLCSCALFRLKGLLLRAPPAAASEYISSLWGSEILSKSPP
jgi:hypothetical protein